jgi:hypothetical protein
MLRAVLLLLLGAGAATGYTLERDDSPPLRVTHRAHSHASVGYVLPAGDGPFHGARRVTVDKAERIARYARERPDDPAASDATLNTVWATAHRFAFEYDSGIEVQVQPWGSTADPASTFLKLAVEFHLKDGPTTIRRDPAILISLGEASPASVEFVRDGIKITVFGELSDDVLRRVAESIR